MTDLMELIHPNQNPYLGFSEFIDGWPNDTHGWGGHPEFFDPLVKRVDPRLIIEVGSWKGRSAITMGKKLKALGRGRKIVCVDTWLGATEFIGAPKGDSRDTQPSFGYPQVYYQFLANIVRAGLTEQVIPFPQTSINAARFLHKNGVKADMIYIDGSHEEEDVRADLFAYEDVLAEGGIMFGDDYCEHWSGVVRAVVQYAVMRGFKVQHIQYPGEKYPSDYWVMSQNGDVTL